jgi:hypothetical protein
MTLHKMIIQRSCDYILYMRFVYALFSFYSSSHFANSICVDRCRENHEDPPSLNIEHFAKFEY